MTKIATNTVAKASVAFVTVAMMFTLVAPAKAATTTELEAQIAALLAQIATLQAQMGGGTTMTCDVPAQPLTIGSQGADVTALQNLLINAGEVIPAGATGYFGSQTQAALASWQAANGVSPAVGYYGPITKSAMESACVVTTPDEGDDNGDMGSDGLGSDEGSIDSVSQVSADESKLDEGELGGLLAFDVEIEGDVEIDRLDVYLDSTDAGAQSDNADDYFKAASLWVDGDMVAEIDVDEFDEDTTYGKVDKVTGDTKEYRLRFSGLGLVFEDGDKPEFQVALEAINNIDSTDLTETWALDYPDFRYMDGAGFTDTLASASVEEDFTFSAEDKAELDISKASDSPDATTLEIDDNDDSEEYDIFVFNIEEQNGVDITIEDLKFNATTTGSTTESDVISEMILYDGSTELASESVPDGGVVTFENLGLELDADEDMDLTLAMVFKGTDDHGEGTQVSVQFASVVDAEDAHGNDEGDITIAGTPTSDTFTLRSTGVALEMVSEDFSTVVNSDTDLTDDEGVYTFKFTISAFGDDFYFNKTASRGTTGTTTAAEYTIVSDGGGTTVTTGTTTESITSTADTVSGDYVVNRGETETFTLKVTFDPATSDYFGIQLGGTNYTTTAGGTTFTAGSATPSDRFLTEEYSI